MKILTFALAATVMFAASVADAKPRKKKSAAPVKPSACMAYSANPESKAIGPWKLQHRDDGQAWVGPWNVEIKADGSWTTDGKPSGFWCQSGDMIFLGYSDAPHTTYRGLIGVNSIQGVESWNGGGTGVFEMTR